MATRKRELEPSLTPHRFDADVDTPADPYSGTAVCRHCWKPGREGDAQHPADAPVLPWLPATPPGAAEIDSRILGEGGEAA